MGNPIIQGWMRKKPMCFVSIRLSYQVLHFGHTVKLTFVCCKMYIKTNPITLKLVLTHLTKAAFHLLSDRKEVQVKDTTGQQDATIHRGVTNYTDFYFICVSSCMWKLEWPTGFSLKVWKRILTSSSILSRTVTDPTKDKSWGSKGITNSKCSSYTLMSGCLLGGIHKCYSDTVRGKTRGRTWSL